jgi:4-amino-4-deoxy-L-arabinose transferase-like glycosyltransferase
MTAVLDRPAAAQKKVGAWLMIERRDRTILVALLVLAGLIHGIGFDGFPGRINDDEGTYMAQAYAMEYRHSVAHYTYWYDHPFGGWLLIALATTLTQAFHWAPTAVTAGRLVMLVAHLISCALLYGVARRLDFGQLAAVAAVLLFSLSPLAVFYQRMVFLDNIAVMWVLAAFYFALSPRRSVSSALGAGACLAAAIWSKETTGILLPVVYYALRQNSDERNRRIVLPAFWAICISLVLVYPLYAMIKNELFEGPGHVSLIWSLKWQVLDRTSSGTVLDTHSATYGLVMQWMHSDPLLFVVGTLTAVPALAVRRLRPIAVASLIQVVMMVRGGYMPFPFVTAMLPFAALLLPGVVDAAWANRKAVGGRWPAAARQVALAAAIVLGLVSTETAATRWPAQLAHAMITDDSAGSREATQWFLAHEPRNAIVLTDDNIWKDLVLAGQKPDPVWLFKLDLDPAVKKRVGGWQGIDYIIIGPVNPDLNDTLPVVGQGIKHSTVLMTFPGGFTIRRVKK